MLEILDEQCTGCTMCGQLCPTGAIQFEIKDGFRYPKVVRNKCINCDLCNKRCPAKNNNIEKNSFPKVYAGWINDEEQRINCTSGGILFELSKFFLENNGYVAGVAWTDDYKNAKYELIHEYKELYRITQTKYFQPEMSEIFVQIKEKLDKGSKVLFIGTSCSNAGLKSFLNREYNNLYCCDFVCRGYTSQLYHQKRVQELESAKGSKVKGIFYKNKSIGWEQFGTKFDFENGESYYVNRYDDPYEYMLQINDYVTRTSCFECKYRGSHRITDITVGDFWGIKGLPKDAYKKGVSAILINSKKGEILLSAIDSQIQKEERSLWELAKGNHCLLGQLPFNSGREIFYEDLQNLTINEIHKKYGNITSYKNEKRMKKVKKVIYYLLHINIISSVKYNFLNRNVIRDKGKYLIPFRGTCVNIEKNGSIILHSNLILNALKHKGSRDQTFLHIYPDGKLIVNGRVRFAATSSVDILPGGTIELGELDSNYGTVIVCANKISIDDGAEFGRNVIIYDSNFHPTKLNKATFGRPLIIERHVWLCTGVCVTKGLTIGEGSICSINSSITKNVKPRSMVMGNPAKCVMEDVEW